MRAGTILKALTVVAALALGTAAVAQLLGSDAPAFGSCDDAAYMARFDERLRSGPLGLDHPRYDCVERARVSVSTRSGPREIRVLHDRHADWVTDEALLRQVDRGVRAAAAQLGRIGAFDMRNVSILVADDFPPRVDAETFSRHAAWTQPDATGSEPECQIIFFVLGPGGTDDYTAGVIAHEIFHCVQKATLSPEQMNSHTRVRVGGDWEARGGAWWMEGSADWFASMAVDGVGTTAIRAARFDELSPTTALHHMSYESLPFFWWLSADRGETAVLPFLAGMASGPSDREQIQAMADAMPAARWLAFAKAYLDGEVRRPRGEAVTLTPQEGDTLRWDASRVERRSLAPFVLTRGWIEASCGTWRTRAEPGEVHAVKPDGGAWGVLPPNIDTEAGDAAWFRLAAINTGAASRELVFDLQQQVRCEGCGGNRIDSCLAGTWRLSAGGAAEWMRRNFPPGVRMPVAESTGDDVTFTRTGGYTSGDFSSRSVMTIDEEDGVTRGDGRLNVQAGGRWSAEGGVLRMCPTAERVQGRVVVTRPDGSRGEMDLSPEGLARSAAAYRDMIDAMPPELLKGMPAEAREKLLAHRRGMVFTPPAPREQTMTYVCDGDTVRTTLPVRGYPPIESTYRRVR